MAPGNLFTHSHTVTSPPSALQHSDRLSGFAVSDLNRGFCGLWGSDWTRDSSAEDLFVCDFKWMFFKFLCISLGVSIRDFTSPYPLCRPHPRSLPETSLLRKSCGRSICHLNCLPPFSPPIYRGLPHAVSSLCLRSRYRHNNLTRC